MRASVLRRAEVKDIPQIKQLFKHGGFGRDDMEKALKRRYGDPNLHHLIDSCPIALVATTTVTTFLDDNTPQSVEHIEAFIAFSLAPPPQLPLASGERMNEDLTSSKTGNGRNNNGNNSANPTGAAASTIKLNSSNWDKWISLNYKFTASKIHNSVFVSFFCGESNNEEGTMVLEQMFRCVFEMIPYVENIIYFLPDSVVLFPPFSSQRPSSRDTATANTAATTSVAAGMATANSNEGSHKNIKKGKSALSLHYFTEMHPTTTNTFPYSLQVCQRKEFYPIFEVRKGRVEDCDDLLPILKKNRLMQPDQGDHYMSDLLESKSETTRCLVAEVEGQVVGFMCIDRKTDQNALREDYSLEPYDNLVKIPSNKDIKEPFKPTEEQLAHQNTFHITLFCIEPQFAALSDSFLKFAFHTWPDLEWCAFTARETAPESPLLRYCSLVPSKYSNNEHLLYVTNRYGIQSFLTLTPAQESNIGDIQKLVHGMDNIQDFTECIQETLEKKTESVEKPTYSIFVASTHNQVVGTMVLEYCTQDRARALLDQFDIESFFDTKWSTIGGVYSICRYFIINPLFEMHSRYVCQEVMRQLDTNCILFSRKLANEDKATRKIISKEFIPVKPRRMIEYPNNLRDGQPIPAEITGNLQIITMPLVKEPRLVVNTPIVVVGGSDASLALLESLIYTTNIHFANLVLVSIDGIPTIEADSPFVSSELYTPLSLKQLALDYYINVIQDTVIQIRRDDKTLILQSTFKGEHNTVSYEYLILSPGLQYFARSLGETFSSTPGVHGMNRAEFPGLQAHLKNLALRGEEETKVIVYGRSLQAYMTVNYCLSLGIAAKRIHFINPSNHATSPLFQDKELNDLTIQKLIGTKINYHAGFSFVPDRFAEVYGQINSITIKNSEAADEVIVDNIGSFIYADTPSIDQHSFHAVNDANLIYDNGIVIDNVCRTKDPYIFAMGSATKYSVNLQTKWSHSLCDAREVGTRLAWLLLHLFDPNFPVDLDILKRPHNDYSGPVKVFAKLPGDLFYFNYHVPVLPSHIQDPKRKDLINFKPSVSFSRIRIDSKGYIYAFTYLGPSTPTSPLPKSNLGCLYGRHEKYFNRLVSRFEEGVIPDFISFFNETWALVMFHDRFPAFLAKLLEEVAAASSSTSTSIAAASGNNLEAGTATEQVDLKDIMSSLALTSKPVSNEEGEALYKKFDESPVRTEWNEAVFNFLMTTEIFKSYP